MMSLKGKQIYLRALEPEDLFFLQDLENNEEYWGLSNTQTPYSKYTLENYIQNAQQDIYEAKQLRLVICNNDHANLGLIDLFDFDPKNQRAGIGIIIKEPKNRRQGTASEALSLLINYCFRILDLHQIYANVSDANTASLKLFDSKGFKKVGLKKDWIYFNSEYSDEWLLQLINN